MTPLHIRTPLLESLPLGALIGAGVRLKLECVQPSGSFKIRGAANFVYSIPKGDLQRGVVAYSSGNHAQAVAIAAASVGIPATIVMPEDAPRSKMEATRASFAARWLNEVCCSLRVTVFRCPIIFGWALELPRWALPMR